MSWWADEANQALSLFLFPRSFLSNLVLPLLSLLFLTSNLSIFLSLLFLLSFFNLHPSVSLSEEEEKESAWVVVSLGRR